MASVYGIGNPLIDILCHVDGSVLSSLGLSKGTMLLLDEGKREKILNAIEGKNPEYHCGGSCPNTMITMRMLGADTTIAGGIGDDREGLLYRQRLEESGVRDNLVTFSSPTGSSIILLSPDGERTLNTYLGANRLFDSADVLMDSVKNAELFYFTGYMWDTQPQQRAVKHVMEYAKSHNIKIAFDLADPFAVGRYRSVFFELLEKYCDIVFANKEEARFLVENYDAYECCRSMGKIVPIAVVKTGKSGSCISDHGKMVRIPLMGPSSALDTTGAGDTFAAGFLYGYLRGWSSEKAGMAASYLAGEIISTIGAQFPKSREEELRDAVNSFGP